MVTDANFAYPRVLLGKRTGQLYWPFELRYVWQWLRQYHSYMSAPLGDRLALLSSNPEYPVVDSEGVVYITNHPHEFDFSKGPQQIADQLWPDHAKISKRNNKIPLHSYRVSAIS